MQNEPNEMNEADASNPEAVPNEPLENVAPPDEQPPEPVARPTTIDLLRHGQVVTPNLFCAPSNEPLGNDGWKQLTLATRPGQWDLVISSPSRRCHDFARLLAQRLNCPFGVDPRFGEMDFGDWIGQPQTTIWEEYPELMQQLWYQPRRFVAPNGEAMEDFIERVQQAWDELQTCYAGQNILLLTHAGVIRVVLAKVLNILYQRSLRFEVGYAQLTRIRTYPDGEASLVGHGLPHA